MTLFDARFFDPRLFDVGAVVVAPPEYWYGTAEVARRAAATAAVLRTVPALDAVRVQRRAVSDIALRQTTHARADIRRTFTATIEG
jgi:hypothetical protein